MIYSLNLLKKKMYTTQQTSKNVSCSSVSDLRMILSLKFNCYEILDSVTGEIT